MRLSQLQDIGGCRIIVENNDIVDQLVSFIMKKLEKSTKIKIDKHKIDYRKKGRDDSGYRAFHIVVQVEKQKLEIQLRSKLQHYWAESIERTSIIYKHNLKALEGDPAVIAYYKKLSDMIYEVECGRKVGYEREVEIEKMRENALKVIERDDGYEVLHSKIGREFIEAMKSKNAKRKRKLHNWLLIFNWNTGSFENWSLVEESSPMEIVKRYAEEERNFPYDKGFEVVLIGATDVETIQHTHSHYFGIQSSSEILDEFKAITHKASEAEHHGLDYRCRLILQKLATKKFWNTKTVTGDTIKNHFCQSLSSDEVDQALDTLLSQELLLQSNSAYSLNPQMKDVIENTLKY